MPARSSLYKTCSTLLVLALLATQFVACASTGGTDGREIREGRIERLWDTQISSGAELGLGAVVGGVAGGALGSLIGAGTGRDVAIAVGALAGIAAGEYAQGRYDQPRPAQSIIVRLNSGVLVAVTQIPPEPALRLGQRVYVTGSGSGARVAPI